MNFDKSLELHARAKQILPCATQTLSKGPDRFPFGAYPIYLDVARGSLVIDVDGNQFVDYISALGPIILGHDVPAVTNAIRDQLNNGILFSLNNRLEIEVAEQIIDMVPSAEAVRFVKTGSTACEAAVRCARAYTKRNILGSSGYHGWSELFQAAEIDNRGAVGTSYWAREDFVRIFYNNFAQTRNVIERYNNSIACVIIEPMLIEAPAPGYLEMIRELCTKYGIVLIFDEVVTAFRFANGGAQEYFGVIPDLTCLGKAMANGMPLGAVVGRKDIMQAFEQCFVSGTYHGELLSLAAARATLNILQKNAVVRHIWDHGNALITGFNLAASKIGIPAEAVGYGPVSRQIFKVGDAKVDNLLTSIWLQETARDGYLFGPIQYPSFSHSATDLTGAIQTFQRSLLYVDTAWRSGVPESFLDALPIRPLPFRR